MLSARRRFLKGSTLGLAGPHGVTLIGRLFEEGTLGRAGLALERAFGVADERPPGV